MGGYLEFLGVVWLVVLISLLILTCLLLWVDYLLVFLRFRDLEVYWVLLLFLLLLLVLWEDYLGELDLMVESWVVRMLREEG
jgi:hypothetical protein